MQIAIVLYPGMTALDALGPYELLKMLPGAEIRFVAAEPGPITTDRGILIIGATHGFDETQHPDMLLVPGSEANTATAMADRKLINWVKQAHSTSKWTTSVCSGALVLAAAGILDGLPATTHWAGHSSLPRLGAIPMEAERIVRSGKIWTAAGVSAGIDLALALIIEIAGRETAEIIQLLVEYDPRPPVDSGHPAKARPEVMAKAKSEMARLARNPRDYISVPTILWRHAIAKARRRIAAGRS
jgi:transcriptional regulator GlxA family with amidase domain